MRAEQAPTATAITCEDEVIDRRELERRSNQAAHGLIAAGVEVGSFVTIALPNSIDFFVTALAAWKCGAVPQPISPHLPQAERQAIVDLAGSVVVIGADPAEHRGRQVVERVDDLVDGQPSAPLVPDLVSPALKAPTSGGSTGQPKLIVATASSSVPANSGVAFGLRENGCQLVPGPLYHNGPFVFSTMGLLLGQHLVVMPRFDPIDAVDAMERHRVQWVNFVPTMMLRISRYLRESGRTFDTSSVDVVWHMAAPCPRWLKEEWIELVGPERLVELYGGTESQVVTRITGSEWLDHRGSVGKPVSGEIRILSEDGHELPRGEVGEIFMRPPPGTPPSYRYVGATARSIDEWETLGDLGWMDDDGYLYISDRRTDMIVSGGANIFPAEVEAAIESHPLVGSCVVVGLPDDDLGQRAHAVVQTTAAVTDDELLRYLGDMLVRYKHPRSIEFTDEPLRDDAGKVRRSAIREQVLSRLPATAD